MQSTVVKHKKDGGQSGGVFNSYIIVRVSSFVYIVYSLIVLIR